MKNILFVLLALMSQIALAQTVLTIEGTTVNDTDPNTINVVDIARSTPTTLTYRNNNVTAVNVFGHIVNAGDEVPTSEWVNNLDGMVITGNRVEWNGGTNDPLTHGIFMGYNINALVKWNYAEDLPMAFLFEGDGIINTSGGTAYNIVNKTTKTGVAVRGQHDINIYNNTFYSEAPLWNAVLDTGTWRGLIEINNNTYNGLTEAYTPGTKIKNNIFYTKHQIYNIKIDDAECLPDFESDYNIFWCEAGTPWFQYLGQIKTFAQWQALGYDLNSQVLDPNFVDFTNFVPTVRLNYGTDLGSTWEEGLSTTAVWSTSAPATTNQNGTWQVGARIYAADNSYSFYGPSSGDINTASTTFTIIPNTTYSGTITVTPSGTGSGGLSPIVKTFSSSVVPQTFTITPTVAGSITLTPTNNGALANPANLTYVVNGGTPDPPTSVYAVAGNTTATVSFVAPVNSGGYPITGYTVTSIPSGGVDSNAGSTSLLHVVTGLTNGTSYTFTVRTTTSFGTSSASSASNAIVPAPISVANYYLAPNGNDVTGDGSITNPWFTLNKVWTVIQAGDLVYMRGGTYSYPSKQKLGLSSAHKNGTAQNKIRVFAYPGEIPNLTTATPYDFDIQANGTMRWPQSLLVLYGDYFHFKGIEISYCADQVDRLFAGAFSSVDSNYNIFEQLNIHHCVTGLQIQYNSTGNLILNCDAHHNANPNADDPYGGADGMELTHTVTGVSNTMRGCRLWWNSDDGMDLFTSEGNLLIENCWSFYNGYIPDTFDDGGHTSDGNGFKFGRSDLDHGNSILVTARNCIAYRNRTSGFHQNGLQAAVAMHNNTTYLNGAQGFWFGSFNKANQIINNIAFNNAAYCALTAESNVITNNFLINNTVNPAFTVTNADFVSLDQTQLLLPRKANGDLPDITFLKLATGSDLINGGTNIGLPYSGSAPDLGASEIIETVLKKYYLIIER